MARYEDTHFGSRENFLAFHDARKQERQDEVSQMSHPGSRFHPSLATYALQRTAEGRRIEGPTLSALRQGQETVHETRQQLHMGRGNVSDDIQRTNHGSSRRTATAREIQSHFSNPHNSPFVGGMHSAVAALQTRAGNCGEHADLATMLHLKRLDAGQEVHSVGSNTVDHAWSEVRAGKRTSPHDVIMDAWGKGSAVLREDSAFAEHASSVQSGFSVSHKHAAIATSRFEKFADKVSNHDAFQRKVAQKLDEKDRAGFQFSKKSVFAPTPVRSEEFRSRTSGMLDKLTKVETMRSAFKATVQDLGIKRSDNPVEFGQVKNTVLARRDISKQIMAAGAARDTGASVSMATRFARHF